MHQLTDGGTGGWLLTAKENLIADYLNDPRAACVLAPFVVGEVTEEAVISALVSVLEGRHGRAEVELICGERRDVVRSAALRETTRTSRLL